MTMQTLQSHLHQASTHLAALEAVITSLDPDAIPEPTIQRALHKLADVESRLDGLAERLSEAFDPVSAG